MRSGSDRGLWRGLRPAAVERVAGARQGAGRFAARCARVDRGARSTARAHDRPDASSRRGLLEPAAPRRRARTAAGRAESRRASNAAPRRSAARLPRRGRRRGVQARLRAATSSRRTGCSPRSPSAGTALLVWDARRARARPPRRASTIVESRRPIPAWTTCRATSAPACSWVARGIPLRQTRYRAVEIGPDPDLRSSA